MKYVIGSSLMLSLLVSPPAFAATLPTPEALIERIQSKGMQTGFQATRIQEVIRQDLKLSAKAKVYFGDWQNYRLSIDAPQNISGVHIWMNKGRVGYYFPDAKLAFQNQNEAGREFSDFVLTPVTDNPRLLQQNYSLQVMGTDIVALNKAYILDIQPKFGFSTPGHRFWIHQDTYQVLREERYWAANTPAYFTSYYENIVPVKGAIAPTKLNKDVKFWEFGAKNQQNVYLGYASVAEAQNKSKQPVVAPTYLPNGFILKNAQVGNFFGTQLTVLNYTDGLNRFVIAYRAKPNVFISLLAGSFSLNLIKKMGDLSYHVPSNYHSAEKKDQVILAYGDLYPEDLQKVVDSMAF